MNLLSILANLLRQVFHLLPREIQELAFKYAHLNGISGFNEMTKTVGYKWLKGFLRHNKQLTIKTFKLLSIYIVKCTNKEVASHCFELQKEVLEKKTALVCPFTFGMLMNVGVLAIQKHRRLS